MPQEAPRTTCVTGSQSRLMQDAVAPNPDPPRCNRSSQHAPARRDHHPRAADIVTARAHRERDPVRGHAEHHPQCQVSRRGEALHRNLTTTAVPAPTRTLPPNTPPTQANAADTSAGRSPRRKRTAADTDAVCMSADAVSPRPAASSFVATSRTAAEGENGIGGPGGPGQTQHETTSNHNSIL